MSSTDNKIAEVLAKFGEPMAGNVWRVQNNAVIYHKTLERIAAQAKIRFDLPTFIRAETDEAVLMVVGHMADRSEWSIGEAVMQGGNHPGNYRVSGKQAAYPYAMAEKRAKDRVILKLIELHGYVYSEEEADEFKQSAPLQQGSSPSSAETKVAEIKQQTTTQDDLKEKIRKARTINAITDLMLHADTQKTLADMPEGIRENVRDYAKERLVALGWPTNKAAH